MVTLDSPNNTLLAWQKKNIGGSLRSLNLPQSMKFVHKPQNQIWYVSQLLKSVQIRSKAVCTAIAVDVTPTWRLRWYLKIKKRWDPRVSKCSVKNKKILVGPTFSLSFFFLSCLASFHGWHPATSRGRREEGRPAGQGQTSRRCCGGRRCSGSRRWHALMPGSGGGRNHLPSQWGRRTRGAQWRAPHAQLLECRAGGEGKYSCTRSDPVSLMAGDRGRGRTHCRTWSSLIRRATGWETTSYFLCHSVRSQYAGTHRTWGCCREAAVASATFGKWRNKLMDVDGEVDNARASATCGHGLLRRREVEDAAPPLLSDAPCFVTGK